MEIIDRGLLFDASQAPDHQRTNCFTSLLVLPDDTLLVSFRYGRTKDDVNENIMMRRSADAGHTWETVFEGLPHAVEGVHGAWRHAGIGMVAPDRLMGAFCWFDRSDPSRPLASPETQGTLPSRVFLMESADRGRTWADLREVDTRPFTGIATTGAVMRLHTGDLALPYEAWKDYDDPSRGYHHAILRLSHDGGYTFDPAVVVAHDPSGDVFYWDQRQTVDPASGQLVAMFWTHHRGKAQDINIHIAWGTPDGRTWTAPRDTGIAGQIACPLALPDGRLLAVYVHRHDPPSLRAVLSEDGGRTWDLDRELVFYESRGGAESGMGGARDFGAYWSDMFVWSFGHPEARLLSNGDVVIAHYGGRPDALSMHWVRVRV
jgi:hypothetical protein